MTIRHLFVFKTVCEETSITRAADKLFMTQPAVSHAISALEEEAGTPLFDRSGRTIRLNQRGRAVYEKACAVLDLFEELKKSLEDLDRSQPLRLGSSITIANYWLPGLIGRFSEIFPDIQVKVSVDSALAVSRLLRENEIDIALIEGASYQEKFESTPFSYYRVIPLCSKSYLENRLRALAAGENSRGRIILPARALEKEKLLLREKGSAIRDVLDAAMLQRDLELSASWESVNSQALIKGAEAGLGITFLPDIMAEELIKESRLVTFEIEGMELRNENHLVLPPKGYLCTPARRFVELVLEEQAADC